MASQLSHVLRPAGGHGTTTAGWERVGGYLLRPDLESKPTVNMENPSTPVRTNQYLNTIPNFHTLAPG